MKIMNSIVIKITVLLMLAGSVPVHLFADTDVDTQWVEAAYKAKIARQPAPLLSQSGLTSIDAAYDVQMLLVNRLLADALPAGYKAGLTSVSAQKKFAVDTPVAGVLLPGGESTSPVRRQSYGKLMIETEIGFVMARRITEPVNDIAMLVSAVLSIIPVIELPDLAFDTAGLMTGPDIIANNVASRSWIKGEVIPMESLDIDSLTVQLWHNGERLSQTSAKQVMNGQWYALQWLVNRTLASGWTIEPGQLLITGAIGPMMPGEPGKYRADFGKLGQISFSVVE